MTVVELIDLLDHLDENAGLGNAEVRIASLPVVTIETITDAYGDMFVELGTGADVPPPTVTEIIAATARWTGLTPDCICSDIYQRHVTQARGLAMTLVRDILRLSYPVIGDEFDRDHSTVITAVRRTQSRIKADDVFRHKYASLRKELENLHAG